MARGVGRIPCDGCRRKFGGVFAQRLHHDGDRCRTAREMRRVGLRRRDDGTWVQRYRANEPIQLRLFRQGRPRRVGQRFRTPIPWAWPPESTRADPHNTSGQSDGDTEAA